MRTPFLILLTAIALLVSLPTLGRAEARLELPTAVLRAGERVTLAWSDLRPGSHEVEFELSLDGGRWVRVSPELEARDGHWQWVVPAMPSAHARLRLRVGGRAPNGMRSEEVAALSAEFTIHSDTAALGTDWWHVGEHRAVSAWLGSGANAHWSATAIALWFVPESAPATPAPAEQPAARLDPRAIAPASLAAAIPLARRPRDFPLRN